MGGYPPGLPPLQGPVDGLVSMGSMQPLHPGGPPPHHLPPGVPGLSGIPPPGKNFILLHSLISSSYSLFSSLSQLFQEVPAAHCGQAFPHWESQGCQQQGLSHVFEQVAQHLCPWAPGCLAAEDTWQRLDSADQGAEGICSRHSNNMTCAQKVKYSQGRSCPLYQWMVNEWSVNDIPNC